MKDDSGWSEVEWFVDAHKIEGGKFPTSPLLDKEFWWDTRFWGDGKHTFGVVATDEDGKTGVDAIVVYTNNGVPPKRPKLIITEHQVTRHGNYLGIDLVVENRGEAVAMISKSRILYMHFNLYRKQTPMLITRGNWLKLPWRLPVSLPTL